MRALDIFNGSDGTATKAYYAELEMRGIAGLVAMNLFRAQKCSTRAKAYRGGIPGRGSYKGMAYERKQWSLGCLCDVLMEHAKDLGMMWGWKEDPASFVPWVLYVDLPAGQVSFHSPARGKGPAYAGEWDRQHASGERILKFCDDLMASVVAGQGSLFAEKA